MTAPGNELEWAGKGPNKASAVITPWEYASPMTRYVWFWQGRKIIGLRHPRRTATTSPAIMSSRPIPICPFVVLKKHRLRYSPCTATKTASQLAPGNWTSAGLNRTSRALGMVASVCCRVGNSGFRGLYDSQKRVEDNVLQNASNCSFSWTNGPSSPIRDAILLIFSTNDGTNLSRSSYFIMWNSSTLSIVVAKKPATRILSRP
jgi:hypothetical protein